MLKLAILLTVQVFSRSYEEKHSKRMERNIHYSSISESAHLYYLIKGYLSAWFSCEHIAIIPKTLRTFARARIITCERTMNVCTRFVTCAHRILAYTRNTSCVLCRRLETDIRTSSRAGVRHFAKQYYKPDDVSADQRHGQVGCVFALFLRLMILMVLIDSAVSRKRANGARNEQVSLITVTRSVLDYLTSK